MGIIKKESKEDVIKLMLQGCSSEEIAQQLNYSVETIRKVFTELREEYEVNSKTGLAVAYLRQEFQARIEALNHLLKIMDTTQMGTSARTCTRLPKSRKKR